MKVVLGLSGGMDSATLLGLLLEQGYEAHCCSFRYGSKHNVYEGKAASDLIHFYKDEGFSVYHYEYELAPVFKNFTSNLLKSGGPIPEGHYNDENMKKTVVPGRNLIMASIMAGLAESIGAEKIALGVHSGDHHIYPDCRPEFIKALRETVLRSTNGAVDVITPFENQNKASILLIGHGLSIQVPYGLTRTCYKDQLISCGKCGSCRERLEAFELVGMKDPIPYEQ